MMPITVTRSPDYEPRIAELFQAMNRLAGGYEVREVIEAAANLLVAGIHGHIRTHGGSKERAVAMARAIGEQLGDQVAFQWDRRGLPEDVVVPRDGN
jgi:hypothetical protein